VSSCEHQTEKIVFSEHWAYYLCPLFRLNHKPCWKAGLFLRIKVSSPTPGLIG